MNLSFLQSNQILQEIQTSQREYWLSVFLSSKFPQCFSCSPSPINKTQSTYYLPNRLLQTSFINSSHKIKEVKHETMILFLWYTIVWIWRFWQLVFNVSEKKYWISNLILKLRKLKLPRKFSRLSSFFKKMLPCHVM